VSEPFVVLGLDPAKAVSGSAVLQIDGDRARLLANARVTTQADRAETVARACALSAERDMPLVVVAEEWDPPRHKRPPKTLPGVAPETSGFDQKWTYKTILGMGEGWGRWTAEFERFGVRRIERVTPNVWRDAIFGKKRPKDTESLKRAALFYARARLGLEGVDDNVADAVCIGLWGMYAPAVLDAARKERKKRGSM